MLLKRVLNGSHGHTRHIWKSAARDCLIQRYLHEANTVVAGRIRPTDKLTALTQTTRRSHTRRYYLAEDALPQVWLLKSPGRARSKAAAAPNLALALPPSHTGPQNLPASIPTS